MSEEWRELASCRGMDVNLFVPTIKRGKPVQKQYVFVKSICAKCPVRLHCLEFALNNDYNEHGIFGGLSPRARQEILRKRRAVKQA